MIQGKRIRNSSLRAKDMQFESTPVQIFGNPSCHHAHTTMSLCETLHLHPPAAGSSLPHFFWVLGARGQKGFKDLLQD